MPGIPTIPKATPALTKPKVAIALQIQNHSSFTCNNPATPITHANILSAVIFSGYGEQGGHTPAINSSCRSPGYIPIASVFFC